MKNPYISLIILLFLCFIYIALHPVLGMADGADYSAESLSGGPAAFSAETKGILPAGVDRDWFSTVRKNIQAEEYHVTSSDHAYLPDIKGGFQAPNRAHNLRTCFTPLGPAVIPRTATRPEWVWRVNLTGYGYSGHLKPVAPPEMSAHENRMEYRRGELVEWYVNSPKGLEQGFTLKSPPSSRPKAGGLLVLEMEVIGNLEGSLDRERDLVDFTTPGGVLVIRYGGLEVRDDTGRDLIARIDYQGGKLRLLVDDARAVYPLVIDPLAESPDWSAESNQEYASLGNSVGTAGDVNGDGYDDVIIGAEEYDSGNNDTGRVYVYLGSADGLAVSPAWTMAGASEGYGFGSSVGTAGDVNGDGYADVIVGAKNIDKAYVFQGSADGLAASPIWTVTCDQNSASFGNSVSTAGDVNHDGFSDIVVGAPYYSNGQTWEGRAYIYHGSASGPSTSPDCIIEIDQGDAWFGFSVASAGDVNGDGYADVVIGARRYSSGQSWEGGAFLYYGSSSGLDTGNVWTAESNQAYASFGYSVATAGDVNGDGYSDVIIGAPLYHNGQGSEGRVYVYHGASGGLSTSADWVMEINYEEANFGYFAATAGDINGDGFADVIVGAPYYANGQAEEGGVFVYLGSPDGLADTPAWTRESNKIEAKMGYSVGTAGDVNGDGFSDIIIGAKNYSNGQYYEGRALVFYGSAWGQLSIDDVSANEGDSGTTSLVFTVTLSPADEDTVTVNYATDDNTATVANGDYASASGVLTFSPGEVSKTVTVTVYGNMVNEDNKTFYMNLSDAENASLDDAQGLAEIVDDDTAGFSVGAISGHTVENDVQANFTVKLTSQPFAAVTIAVSSSDTGEGTVSPSSLTFTASNWSTPQTVTVTGVDDPIADGNQDYTIVLGAAVTSDTTGYAGLDPADVTVTNEDNDTAGFTVSGISGNTDEDGTQASFTVKLTSQPVADVTMAVSSSDTGEGTVSPSSLTFTTSNWNDNQTVTVTGADDPIADGSQNYTIVLGAAVTSDTTGYSGLDPADVTVTNEDNDNAGFTVSAISGNTDEDETQASFTVKLTSQPVADVTMAVSSSDTGEGTVSPSSLTFTTSNWNDNQTVTVTGADDPIADGSQNYTIVLGAAVTSDTTGYSGLDPADVTVTNEDNDNAGFTVSAISGNTDEDETQAFFTVKLTSQPVADVTMAVSSSDAGEGTVSPSSLTFTASNWSTPQTVTVTGVDDYIVDGNQDYTIVLGAAVTSDTTGYSGLDPADVTVTNEDNDTAGFTVSGISGNTDEDETQAFFTVKLTSQPVADVTMAVSSSDTGEGTVSPSSLTFTASNWSTPQTVTVTGVDDYIVDGNQDYTIVLGAAVTSDTTGYAGLDPADVTVTNDDNDTAGFTVSGISGNTDEDGTQASFTVKLTSQPVADVTMAVSSSDTGEGTVSPSSLTFTTSNWNDNQTVTVTGADDPIADGNQDYTIVLGAAVTSDTTGYAGLDPADVTVTNEDNDTAGFTVSGISGNTDEDGTQASFTVKLTSQPVADVTMAVSSSDTGEGTVSPSSLTFTTSNWNDNQTVTVTGADDPIADGNQDYTIVLGAAVTSDTTGYSGLDPADVTVTNEDNDTAGFTVSGISGNTDEDGTQASFTVKLTSQPFAAVTIAVSSSDTGEGTVSPSSLTFTASNWSTPQTVTVTGVDDDIADGNQDYTIVLGAAVTSDTTGYSGLDPADVTVTNDDNDTAGFTVSGISGNTNEGGAEASFTVKLNSQPVADVTMAVSSLDTGEGTVSPSSLTFTASNWNDNQTVTVTGADDPIADGNQDYTIVLGAAVSSDTTGYSGLDPADVTVTNDDDDTAGFTVSGISGNTDEDGTQASFTVKLTSQPFAAVTIAVSSSDTGEGTVSPSSLTFTASNWNDNQTVTVTGADDPIADGSQNYTIVLGAAVSSDTTGYSGLDPADVTVTNDDNDTAGFTVSGISGNTDEDGTQASFTVKLTSQPFAAVTIAVSSSDTGEGTVSPSSLTFTASNWNDNQTVTVTGADDPIADGSQNYTIVLGAAVSSDTTGYSGLDPADVTVTNDDNDTAGFTVSGISGNTDEDETQASFTVKLNSQPVADVTIAVSSLDTGEGTVSPSSLTFTASNWSTPQTVTVTGVDDDIADGNQDYTIVLGAAFTSDTTGYAGLDPANVTVTNEDNDNAGFTVSAISGNTVEDGAQATFTVKLNSQPVASVTVGLGSSDTTEGTVSPSSLTFTAVNWNANQTVTVTGVNDDIADGDRSYTINLGSAVSSDPVYNGLDPVDVPVTNVDNDTPGFSVSQISGNTRENGQSGSFTVSLVSEPDGNVIFSVTSSDKTEGLATPSTLTFTPSNWKAKQTVTVTGQDDDVADGNQDYKILLTINTASTTDTTGYASLDPPDVSVTNLDDDSPGFVVGEISNNTDESGMTGTFTVRLAAEPDGNVIFSVTSSDETEGTASPSTLTFTPSNWKARQTVTVTGQDDDLADGNQDYTIRLTIDASATTDATGYASLDPQDVSVTNLDDDSPGFVVGEITNNTDESGMTGTFSVRLTSEPDGNVVLSVTSSDETEGTAGPSTLTFTSSNFSAAQIVTVTGQDDDLADGNQDYTIRLTIDASATTDATGYATLEPPDVSVTNLDDDSPGFVVGEITNNTDESGMTGTFSVRLTSEPDGNVVLSVTSSDETEGTAGPSTLTFTSSNFSAAQIVTVTGQDDDLADGNQDYTIRLTIDASATTDATGYATLEPPDVSVTNLDDDSPGFVIGEISNNTDESGMTGTFSVRLTSEPDGNVVLSVTSSDETEGTAGPSTLTFTSSNFSAAQIVTVTGQDDDLADGNQDYTIRLTIDASATTDATGYATLEPPDVSVTNLDDDSPGFVVGEISNNTDESGMTGTFTVRLTSEPDGNVVLSVTSSDETEGTAGPSTLTFTSSNFSAAQIVTVTGQDDDLADGNQDYTIRLTIDASATTDATGYATLEPPDISVTNLDDDSPGFVVGEISNNTEESGMTGTFTVRLTAEPDGNVVLTVTSSDETEGTAGPSTLTFTPSNWNAGQTVTVTGQDDDLADGNQDYMIRLTIDTSATTDTTGYASLDPPDVSVTNLDDDSPGFVVGEITNNTEESGMTGTFTVRLTSEPDGNVVLSVTSSDVTEGTAGPSTLTFTPSNWKARQTVTVTGQDDDLADGNQDYTIRLTIDASATTDATGYASLDPQDVSVTNLDDDSPGFVVGEISNNTDESGMTGTFSVRLTSEPDGNVVLSVTSSDETEGTAGPSTLTFTSSNFSAAQIVTVTGQDDDLADGNQDYTIRLTIDASATTDATGYASLDPPDVSVTNLDDDSPGFVVGEITNNTDESGMTGTFSVRLTSEPDGNVVLSVTSSDVTEGTAGPSTLTFTPSNWKARQTVTVTGQDDDLADGNQDYTIRLTIDASATTDATGYASLDPQDVSVTNLDDDSPGFVVGEISNNTDESGMTGTFSVRLTSEPDGNVVLSVTSSDETEGTAGPSTLTFTSSNFSAAQIVTVTGQDDDLADGNQDYTIRLTIDASATTDATGYASLDPPDVSVTNLDDDSPGFVVGEITNNTDESGMTGTFSVRLTSEPDGNVVLSVTSSDVTEGTAGPSTLTFTPSNWSTAQKVTVTGQDDDQADGNQDYKILLTVDTSATTDTTGYADLDPPDVPATNLDNESAGLVIGDIAGQVGEDQSQAVFTVRMASAPDGQVVLGVTSSDVTEGTVNPAGLTFTASDWNRDRRVTVTGQDDDIADGNQIFTVSLEVDADLTTDTTGYASLSPQSLSFTNLDDDISYTVKASRTGTGSGKIITVPSVINCGTNCSATVAGGAQLTFFALPTYGSTFDGWSGQDCSGSDSCTLILDSDKSVTASFSAYDTQNADLSIAKTVDAYQPEEGDQVIFTLTLTNHGPDPASGIEVTDILPAGLEYVGDDSGGNYDPSNGLWTVAGLEVGASVRLNIVVLVLSQDEITNTAEITGTGLLDPEADNDSAGVTLHGTGAQADLAVDLAADRAPQVVGDKVVYTINVSNSGPGMAGDVRLTDYLPSEIADPEYFISGREAFTTWPDNWQLSLGDLEARSDLTVWIRGTLASLPADGLLTNTVTVESGAADPSPGNNLATDETAVLESALTADLWIVKASDLLDHQAGEEVVFTLTAANLGPEDASDVEVRDLLPDGLSYLGDDGGGTYDPFSGLWELESLAGGESRALRITTRADRTGTLTNTALISSLSVVDDNYANNSSTRVIGVGTGYMDLALATVLEPIDGADPDQVQNNDRFKFRVNLAYNSPSKATGVTIQTSLPDGLGTTGFGPYPGCYDESTGIWYLDNDQVCANLGQSSDEDDELNPVLDLEIKVQDASAISQATVMAAIRTVDQPDPDSANNTSCQVLNRVDHFVVDLAVLVDADRTEVGTDEEATFTIKVLNTGPDTASGLRVQVVFPEELGYTGAIASRGTYDRETGLWSIGILKNNESVEILVKAGPLADSGQAVFQAVLSRVEEGEINPDNNSDSVSVTIVDSGEAPNVAQRGSGSGGCFINSLF